MSIETGLRALFVEVAREVVREELAKLSRHDEYLSPARAASIAEVAPATIRRWIREGKLPPHRAGRLVRVCRAELEQMMKDGRRRSVAKHADESPEDRARRMFG